MCALAVQRWTTGEIADHLVVSPRTVEKHLESIFTKLDVGSRDQLRWRLSVIPGDTMREVRSGDSPADARASFF